MHVKFAPSVIAFMMFAIPGSALAADVPQPGSHVDAHRGGHAGGHVGRYGGGHAGGHVGGFGGGRHAGELAAGHCKTAACKRKHPRGTGHH